MIMKRAAIIDIIRTPWGIPGGAMAKLKSHDLAATVLSALSARNGTIPDGLDHIIFGQALPSTFPSNIARYASLLLRWPENIPAYTVQSNCASGMQALRSAYYLIASGNADVIIAGGADSFSAAPFVMRDVRFSFNESNRVIYDTITESEVWTQPTPMTREEKLGELVLREKISDDEQKDFAIASRQGFMNARELMVKHIAPVTVTDRKYGDTIITNDEYPEKPFMITAPYADGAAAVLLMSEARVKQLGLNPVAWIRGFAVEGCLPEYQEKGAPGAVQKLLAAKSIAPGDIGCLELYEDTAAGAIAGKRALAAIGMKAEVNIYGGALSIGKNGGGDGLVMLVSLILSLAGTGSHYGVAAMSSSGGQGIAVLLEVE